MKSGAKIVGSETAIAEPGQPQMVGGLFNKVIPRHLLVVSLFLRRS
jgi:hypothetical protein